MYKTKKGITLISVVVTVIILAMIAGVVVVSGTKIIDIANMQNISTNMLLIQAKGKTISEKAFFENDTSLLKGENINSVNYNSINKLKESEVISEQEENYLNYYVWNEAVLKELGFEEIKLETGEYYIINYITNEVIYTKGVKSIDGKIYYKLSNLKDVTVEE